MEKWHDVDFLWGHFILQLLRGKFGVERIPGEATNDCGNAWVKTENIQAAFAANPTGFGIFPGRFMASLELHPLQGQTLEHSARFIYF